MPNVFINIENFCQKRFDALKLYETVLENFPFPKSKEAVIALAKLRAAESGYAAIGAFKLLREREG